jgi:hypothetical protein
MHYLNNGQTALIRREAYRLRLLIEDCCAAEAPPPIPSKKKRTGPLLKKVKHRGSKAKDQAPP